MLIYLLHSRPSPQLASGAPNNCTAFIDARFPHAHLSPLPRCDAITSPRLLAWSTCTYLITILLGSSLENLCQLSGVLGRGDFALLHAQLAGWNSFYFSSG